MAKQKAPKPAPEAKAPEKEKEKTKGKTWKVNLYHKEFGSVKEGDSADPKHIAMLSKENAAKYVE